MPDPASFHRLSAATHDASRSVRCAILTVSDSRRPDTDASGTLVERLLAEAGHETAERQLVSDDAEALEAALGGWLADADIRAVLITGGTGLGRRDRTIDVVRPHLCAELDGFGELFRMRSFEQVGPAAMLSRAVAGLVARAHADGGDTFVFAMPGSPRAVELAMSELILPELRHLVWLRSDEATKSPAAQAGRPAAPRGRSDEGGGPGRRPAR